MTTLNLISTPLESLNSHALLQAALQPTDTIILLQRGTLSNSEAITHYQQHCTVVALNHDAEQWHQSSIRCECISDEQWAEIIATASSVNSWQ